MFPISAHVCVVLSFFVSLILCHVTVPIVIKLAQEKKLYDIPNRRSSHRTIIPSLGGTAIFLAFSLSVLLFSENFLIHELRYIMAATLVLFALGIKDDILEIAPLTKLGGQIVAATIVVVMSDIRITSFHGLFGIHEIPVFVSILFTIFAIIVITNGFNLIDGIDGLASGVSGLCVLSFGTWFLITGHYEYVVLAFSLLGALIAFFRFNVFGKQNKIFMGDTGSLILGLVISVLMIKFLELNIQPNFPYAIQSAPAISIAILAIPIFDTARVIIVRIRSGRSPLRPDKNHVHHRMITLGYKHSAASLRIMAVNFLFIIVAFALHCIEINILLLVIVLMGSFFSWLPSFLVGQKVKEVRNQSPSHSKTKACNTNS